MNRNKRISELSVSEFASLTKDIIDYAIRSLGELGKSLVEYHAAKSALYNKTAMTNTKLPDAIGKEYPANWDQADFIRCQTQTVDEINVEELLKEKATEKEEKWKLNG